MSGKWKDPEESKKYGDGDGDGIKSNQIKKKSLKKIRLDQIRSKSFEY